MKNILFVLALLVSFGSFGQENKDSLLLHQTSAGEVKYDLSLINNYITCWGDSLTASGGWIAQLSNLSGMTVYNGGTGGESSRTILARQGGDVMLVNNIIIPAETTSVLIASRDLDGGINTALGHKVTPLLQGGAHFNPCFIGDIEGVLQWTGTGNSDLRGDWEFTRTEPGKEIVINSPTPIRTNFDMNKNTPHLQVIFMGQNGGYSDLRELIIQHKLLIEHSKAENTIILGLSSGTAKYRAKYENAMREEFGEYFISLRENLAAPIYKSDSKTILNCYGLKGAGLTPTQKDLNEIALGKLPQQLLLDSVHYTSATNTVIGNLIYTKCKDLNIF